MSASAAIGVENEHLFEPENAPAPAPASAPVAKPKTVKPKTAKSAAPKTLRGKAKDVALPKKPTTVEEWLEAKVKAPTKFTVDENGDLVVPPYKTGEAEITIITRQKTPATADHIRRFFLGRKESLNDPEAEFAEAKRNLQVVYAAYKREEASIDDVLDANQRAAQAQIKVNSLVKFPRNFESLEGLLNNDLSFDWYRRAKIPVPVGTMETTVFPWQAFWTEAPDAIPEFDEEDYEDEERMAGGAKPKRELTTQQRAIIANIKRKKMGGF